MRFIALSTLLLAGLALVGCDYRSDKTESQIAPVSRSVGYAEVKQKVFQVSCQSCHATQNPPLDDYADASKAASAIRKAVFDEKSMPKQGALNREQEEILLATLDLKALEKTRSIWNGCFGACLA